VGETVSVGAAQPIKGRINQSGHLENTSKKKYKHLPKHLQKVRTTIKAINKITHSTPTAEHISEIHQILQNPPPTDTTTPAEAWEALQQNLSETRVSLKQVLTKQDRKRTLTKLMKFQRLLYENPKKAHRWIFEGGESKKLDSVKLGTVRGGSET
jgi:5-bromo-4-chloroindolyl phosphate hydrolysis protein